MAHSTLTPVFVGLRTGLHVLVAALLALVVVRIAVTPSPTTWVALALCTVFAAVYAAGGAVARRALGATERARAASGPAVLWLLALSLTWAALLFLVPEAAYLVFPLFFLYLHVLPRIVGPAAVVTATVVAVVALGLHGGFTVGGVVGPFVGAGVALLIGMGYRALAREAAEREALVADLVATRDRLAATEREQGALAERARLAREIHDTVAQGLSSIQMLLHAAERADPDRPGVEHVRLARQTAADGLAETRRFIRELAPPTLDRGLGAALGRLADAVPPGGPRVTVSTPDDLALPVEVQTALLRIAQGAVANAVQHADAATVRVVVASDGLEARLTVADDGRGFDPVALVTRAPGSDSFGLRAIAERVDQLGGALDVASAPGSGTVLTVVVPRTTDGDPS